MTESEYLTLVSSYTYFGPVRINLLLSYFKRAKNIWKAETEELIEIGIPQKRVLEFNQYHKSLDEKKYFTKLRKLKIGVVTVFDKSYPENLNGLAGAPPVLYFKGRLSKNDVNSVAIVGSRKMTSYGREVAEKFASGLASFGITIVSGLAHGIDTAAHRGAISVGGRTVAVLGNGLDSIYPLENIGLAGEIIKSGGAILSEYPLGYPALPENFANRNRIVSGMSKAIIVVEGAEKSGTLLTAAHAAEQGKAVFAVPGQITSPMSFAPHFLLKNGARIATDVKDVIEELDLQVKVDRERMDKVLPFGKNEEEFLRILASEPMHLDEIVRISGLATGEVSARLTIMEMKGMVRNMGQGVYKKT